MTRINWSDMASVGTVARSHGRHGEVIVNPSTDFQTARFQVGNALFMGVADSPVELRISAARFQRGRPILGFNQISTMAEAEQLRGRELRVPESELRQLPTGAFYSHDLVGCKVRTLAGRAVGVVSDVQGPDGAQRLIVMHGPAEIDVPLAEEICVSIDVSGQSICINPPAGLLELNSEKALG